MKGYGNCTNFADKSTNCRRVLTKFSRSRMSRFETIQCWRRSGPRSESRNFSRNSYHCGTGVIVIVKNAGSAALAEVCGVRVLLVNMSLSSVHRNYWLLLQS